MDKKDMLTIASAVISAASGAISIAFAYKEYKTTMNDHERIQQLEDTVKWMVQSDLDIQKESDQSKN
jgi:hypothetical protein